MSPGAIRPRDPRCRGRSWSASREGRQLHSQSTRLQEHLRRSTCAGALVQTQLHRAPQRVSLMPAALGNGAEDGTAVRTAKPELRPCGVAKHEIQHATDDHEDDDGLDEESD